MHKNGDDSVEEASRLLSFSNPASVGAGYGGRFISLSSTLSPTPSIEKVNESKSPNPARGTGFG